MKRNFSLMPIISTERRRRSARVWIMGLALIALWLAAAPPLAHAQYATYSGSSVDTNGMVRGWGVTDVTTYLWYYHTAYVTTTLTSPGGRVATSGRYQAFNYIRADVSLTYDPTDLGNYTVTSNH